MSGRVLLSLRSCAKHLAKQDYQANAVKNVVVRSFSTQPKAAVSGYNVPESVKRIVEVYQFPNEYPGMVYSFNWDLNGDGVTPLRESAFRIMKPLDLQIAGLPLPKKNPLKVKGSVIPEAGTEELDFDLFDDANEKARDFLSLADHLYCPEGFVPGTRTGVRVITNSAALAPDLVAYLERAPKKAHQYGLPITVYVLEAKDEEPFAGYAVEESEQSRPAEDVKKELEEFKKDVDERLYFTLEEMILLEHLMGIEAVSVASVVIIDPKPDIKKVVGGIEASQKELALDEADRAKQRAAMEKEAN